MCIDITCTNVRITSFIYTYIYPIPSLGKENHSTQMNTHIVICCMYVYSCMYVYMYVCMIFLLYIEAF